MTPVDLGQYTPNRTKGTPLSPERGAAGFDDLLAQVQSLQFSALANTNVVQTMTPDGALGLGGESDGGGAREARINQETQAARQAEVASQNTRGADPSSVQNGVVSERHERVLTQQTLAAESKPATDAKSQVNPQETSRIADLPASAVASESKPTTEKAISQPTGPQSSPHQPAISSDTATANHEQKAGADSGFERSNSNATASKAISVSTTGAAAAANNQAVAKQGSTAQRIGQMLAGKATTQVARGSGTEAQAQVAREPSAKGATQNQTAKARSNSQAQGRSTAEGPEQTKRSEFESLVKSIRLNRGTKSSSATIRLNPPELGKMKIHAQMSDDVLRVRVEASSNEARHLLSERSNELLEALRDRGINVDRFEVVRPESARADLQQGSDQDSNLPDQSLATQSDGQQAANTHARHDSDLPQHLSAQEETQVQDDMVTVAHDARLDVMV